MHNCEIHPTKADVAKIQEPCCQKRLEKRQAKVDAKEMPK